ncbi:MAG TPA: hypothetical protein VMS21_02905 [Methylomirabilota bacterium]|nr:hypothetical protein [Methylomirabilota bacterium]
MNDEQIENLLHQAPRPAAPAGLLEKLNQGIELPRPAPGTENRLQRETLPESFPKAAASPSEVDAPVGDGWRSRLRHWTPALGFGLFFLSCLVLLGIQASLLSELRRQNTQLHAAAAGLEELHHRDMDAGQRLRARLDELERLRKDHEELLQLRTEVGELRSQALEMAALRTENERLLTELRADRDTGIDEAFFAQQTVEAERIACRNNLRQIGLSIRVWVMDSDGTRYPSSVVQMSNEVSTVQRLICPGDAARQEFGSLSWREFRPAMTSYELHFSGEEAGYREGGGGPHPESIVSKCPIHHNYVRANGSEVQIDPQNWREITIDGRLYLKPVEDPTRNSPP